VTIIRTPRVQRDFTIISNSVCLDDRLTMRALGVLVRLLSRPDNWRTNSAGLAEEFNCGRDAVRGALQELQDAGYLRMEKARDESGRWASAWLVFDEPQGGHHVGKPGAGSPVAGFSVAGSSDAGKPSAGKAGPITRTDELRTDVTREEAAPPTLAKKRGTEQSKPDDVPDQVWSDWLKLRKAKKAPVTGTVVKAAIAEAGKAGMSLADFLSEWCVRGSQGLKAEWLTNGRAPVKAPDSEPPRTVAVPVGVSPDSAEKLRKSTAYARLQEMRRSGLVATPRGPGYAEADTFEMDGGGHG
jgi:hypothetical protein